MGRKAPTRWSQSDVEAEAAGRSRLLPTGAQPPEPADQQRVLGQRRRVVDDRVQNLVVPGRRQVEQLPDRLFLGSCVLPPLPLERQDVAVPTGQHRIAGLALGLLFGDCVVHASSSRTAVIEAITRQITGVSFVVHPIMPRPTGPAGAACRRLQPEIDGWTSACRVTSSNPAAIAKSSVSARWRPTNCTPMGDLVAENPPGTAIAGCPVTVTWQTGR